VKGSRALAAFLQSSRWWVVGVGIWRLACTFHNNGYFTYNDNSIGAGVVALCDNMDKLLVCNAGW